MLVSKYVILNNLILESCLSKFSNSQNKFELDILMSYFEAKPKFNNQVIIDKNLKFWQNVGVIQN